MLKGALVGFGGVAQNGHWPAYAASGDAAIVAVVDRTAERRAIAASLMPSIPTYATLDELGEAASIDFVDICTPPAFHPQPMLDAIARGWHVLCDAACGRYVSAAANFYWRDERRIAEAQDHRTVRRDRPQERDDPPVEGAGRGKIGAGGFPRGAGKDAARKAEKHRGRVCAEALGGINGPCGKARLSVNLGNMPRSGDLRSRR